MTNRWIWTSPKPGRRSMRRPQVGRPKKSSRLSVNAPRSARARRSRRALDDADDDADDEEERDDREAAVVEELAREEPAEDLVGAVRVVEDRARCRTRSASSTSCRRRAARAPTRRRAASRRTTIAARPTRRDEARAAEDEHPHADGEDRQVAGDEVARDRQRERQRPRRRSRLPRVTARQVSPQAIGSSHIAQSCEYTP